MNESTKLAPVMKDQNVRWKEIAVVYEKKEQWISDW